MNHDARRTEGFEPPRRQDAKIRESFDPDRMRGPEAPGIFEPSPELDRLAHDVIGAAIEVHRLLGPGYLESVYEEALCIELLLRKISYQRQVLISIDYKDHPVGESRVDLLVVEKLLVELKAVETHNTLFEAQVLSYLKTTQLHLGLLINFNVRMLKDGIKRIVRS